MNSQPANQHLLQTPCIISVLALILCMVACSSNNTPTITPSTFEYQVHVQAKDNELDIPNAQVLIDVADQATFNEVTDTNGTTRFL